jgi:hypothetical protein
MSADVDVDAVDESGRVYDFTRVDYSGKRKDIKAEIKDNILDGKYENNAPVVNGSRDAVGRANDNQLIRHGLNLGAGIAFKVSDKVNIGFEQKFTLPFDDNFDGVNTAGSKSNDFISATQRRWLQLMVF